MTAGAALLLYGWYIFGLASNPPGFYVDESAAAYNAYLVATTTRSESGERFPLYPKYYTESRTAYANPTYLYLLASMYLFVPPSVVSARILAATAVFVAIILLGCLGVRISRRPSIGILLAITALFTPWLFDASRLVLEVFTYPISILFFLFFLHRAYTRKQWLFSDVVLIVAGLALITYSYSIGRLLGPALAFGLLIFVSDRASFISLIRIWALYGVTLLPLAWFNFTNPGALVNRFSTVTYLSPNMPLWLNIASFFKAYLSDISPKSLLYTGDPLLRHHVPVMGGILGVTLVLALLGLLIVLVRHTRDRWWLFIIFGLFVSVLPGALTNDRSHSLRLIAFPVFLLILTMPAFSWILETEREQGGSEVKNKKAARDQLFRGAVVALLMGLTIFQGIHYQTAYWGAVANRGTMFDSAYLPLFHEALALPDRPIYLEDGVNGPGYVHAYWYATVEGIDLSNFVHLRENERAPVGAVVLSANPRCVECSVINQPWSFLLYRTTGEYVYEK
jgi:hypothetical protein